MTCEELLSETVREAQAREQQAFAAVAGRLSHNIVLYGAGNVGRKVARGLIAIGVVPLCFVDRDPNLIGRDVSGIRVFEVAEAVRRWKDAAVFVVTVFHPADEGMQSRIYNLQKLGCSCVISFLPLAWMLEGVLPHFGVDRPSVLLSETDQLGEVFQLLNDEISKEVFRQQLSWRLRADFSSISMPAPDQYFPRDILAPCNNEHFVDGGAYDGDTLRHFPWSCAKAWAVEPDPFNARSLRTAVDSKVTVVEALLGDKVGRARFAASGSMASARSDLGNVDVSVLTLNKLLMNENPSFLKLDVEGDELAALQGATQVLNRGPVVAVCVYHRPHDLWTIPLFLKSSNPEHKFAIRAHAHDGFELVFYSIPTARWLGKDSV